MSSSYSGCAGLCPSERLAQEAIGLWMFFSDRRRRRHSILKEELVNGYKNFNRTMCKIVFHSLLNLTHHTRFLFVPNPNVVSYRP